jgi:DNA-binding CsgD family transcriptional regulator
MNEAIKHGPARRVWGTGVLRSKHPLYRIWTAMLDRCENPDHHAYARYGGRGITVCPQWHTFSTFRDEIESTIGPRPDGKTLDRYPDNDGNYEPGNVRWATRQEQADGQTRNGGLTREQITARRERVQLMLANGSTPRQIADTLGVSIRTARQDSYTVQGKPPALPDQRNCLTCETAFAPRMPWHKFCSETCKREWYRQHPKDQEQETRNT